MRRATGAGSLPRHRDGGVRGADSRPWPSHQAGQRPGHQAGRYLGAAALVMGVAYLAWRIIWSWHAVGVSVAWWLAIPALVVEVSGFGCIAVLTWALWKRPSVPAYGEVDVEIQVDYDVAIVATDKTRHDLRSTLVALRLDPSRPRALVIDHDGRPELRGLADEFGAGYCIPDRTDTSGLAVACTSSDREYLFLLNAGDIPVVGAARSLMSWMHDDVGAVQGVVSATPGDSAEHASNGRHDLTFERFGLNPGLGMRGTGIVTGSGALVRRVTLQTALQHDQLNDALADDPSAGRSDPSLTTLPTESRHSVLWELMPRLAATQMRVVGASGQAVVAEKPLTSASAVAADRRSQVDAGWRLLVGPRGAFRARGLRGRDRLALAAWSVRSLDGFRRVALGAIVLGALLAGRSPFVPSPAAIWYLWAPAFVFAAAALALLSGGTLRPGDRLRGSVRAVNLSVALVVAINSVLVIRGISDRFTHALRPLDHNTQIGLSAISLWLLAGSLDSLRLLARRRQNRRAVRVAASGTGHLDEFGVYVSDITMLGAGLLADHEVAVGEKHRLSFSVPSETGITSIEVSCIVRNVRPDLADAWRVGVEFCDVDSYALNTLAESCAVLPARAALAGVAPSPAPFDDADVTSLGPDVRGQLGPRRLALQLATLLALAGVVSSTAAINAEAAPPATRLVVGALFDVGDPPVVAGPTGTTGAPTNTFSIDTTPNTVTTDSSPPGSAMPTDSIVTDPTSPEVPPASVDVGAIEPGHTEPDPPGTPKTDLPQTDLGGITVIGVCSRDAGPDGQYGGSDDIYGPSVNAVTTTDGTYSLTLEGLACWVSIDPLVQAMQESWAVAAPSLGTPTVVDLGGSGTVTMAPISVQRVARTNQRQSSKPLYTDADTSHATAGPTANQSTHSASSVALPTPTSGQLNVPASSQSSSLPTLIVLLMVALLAGSVLFASAQPSRARRQTLR